MRISEHIKNESRIFWNTTMGSRSRLNIFGKVLFFPLLALSFVGGLVLELLFTKLD